MVVLGLAGILLGLALLIALAYRGWSVLILAPVAAVICALFSREPILAHLTQTFMASGAAFLAQFALGVATLLWVVPLPLAALHQANAMVFFVATLGAGHALRWPSPAE